MINNKTPKAFGNDDTFIFQEENLKLEGLFTKIAKEEEKTLKKLRPSDLQKLDDAFDEEEDMPDSKDFEEFDMAEQSEHSSGSMKVRVQIVEQDQIFSQLRTQKQQILN